MDQFPRISVITVIFNGEKYLEKTIQSVVNQTYPNIEYIIVDGGSTDGTVDIVKKYSSQITRWVSEKDNGIYDAMNKGLSMASGIWVNFLNGGDQYHDSEVLMNLFGSGDTQAMNFIYGDSINVHRDYHKYIRAQKLSRNSLRRSLGVCHQAVFVRKSISPMYNTSFRYKAEYNWVIDIVYSIPISSIRYLPVPVVYYSLGGFSEKGMLANLTEFISTTRKRFGIVQVLLNSPVYLRIYLRYVKYSFTR
jgi:glycosyltransferase involved in cell wall biosynthesis